MTKNCSTVVLWTFKVGLNIWALASDSPCRRRAIIGQSLGWLPAGRRNVAAPRLCGGSGHSRMSALEELDRTILLCRDFVADGLSAEEICHALQSVHVLCVSDVCNLSSHSGQTALVTLVGLLSRMGMQVGLSIPEAAMLSAQPPLSGSFLCKALVASSEGLVTGATVRCDPEFNADIIFVLGDAKVDGPRELFRTPSPNDPRCIF